MIQSADTENARPEGCLAAHDIDMLVVHCSDTPDDQPLTAADIQRMHLGFGWDGIGYHQVIRRDGTRENGRPEYWRGAHAKGANERSLSVCLIGRNSFTPAQMHSLAALLFEWTARYPDARVLGHRDAVETPKTCPNFDAPAWWRDHLANRSRDRVAVGVPTLGLRAVPDISAPLETEALFGEQLDIIERRQGHALVTLANDGYVGWVSIADNLQEITAATHRISAAAVFVLSEPDVTSPAVMRIGMGSLIRVVSTDAGWHRIALPGGRIGYVAGPAALPIGQTDPEDATSVAQRLLNAPYLWGGRSAAGLDCSALVQLALQATGIQAPRNSGAQQEWAAGHADPVSADGKATRRGDLVFWPGHVGICQSPDRLIHANAHHHAVAIEPLAAALARIDAATGQPARIFRLTDQPF